MRPCRPPGAREGATITKVVQAQRTFPTFINRIGILLGIAVAFVAGLFGTVYLSLRSPEVKVPEVVGKSYMEAESALEHSGLKVRKRATRYSADAKPDTVLDQTPRGGEVVKEGQTIAVVVSRAEQKEGETSVSIATKDDKQADKGAGDNKNANENGNANAAAANANANNSNRPKRSANKNTNKNANQNGNANANGNGNAVANSNLGNRLATNTNDAGANRNAGTRPNANTNPDANANRSPNANRNSNANSNHNTNSGRNRNTTNRSVPIIPGWP